MNYAAIRHYDIANGEGVRTSLFVSGCRFHCPECFNQEQQDFNYGRPLDYKVCCEILRSIEEPVISGLSLLGGDPLHQDKEGIAMLVMLCQRTHMAGKNVWLWSGFTWEQVFQVQNIPNQDFFISYMRRELVRNSDVFVDGPFHEALADRFLKWRGSANQRIINVQQSLQQNKVILYKE